MAPISDILAALESHDRESAFFAIKNLAASGFFKAAVKVSRESLLLSWGRGADQFELCKQILDTNHETQLYEALEEASKLNPANLRTEG